jgi:hypothetical protein
MLSFTVSGSLLDFAWTATLSIISLRITQGRGDLFPLSIYLENLADFTAWSTVLLG